MTKATVSHFRVLLVLNLAISLLFVMAILLTPLNQDMIFPGDTSFLAHLGWRGVNGLRPVIDYPHFYGGMTAQFVTSAFQLFGVSYKSLHYAFVMMFGTAAVVLLSLGWTRLPASAIALLLALSAALMLSLFPIEWSPDYWLHRNVTHAWFYNHAGIVLMMALTVFALKGAESRRIEFGAALIAGITLSGLTLLKTPFGVMAPCVVLACVAQRRWISAMLVVGGTVAGMQALDPGLVRTLGSLEHLLNSAAAETAGGLSGRVKFAFGMLVAQAALLAINLVLAGLVLQSEGRAALPFVVSTIICASGYGTAMLTTGGMPDRLLLPFFVVFSFVATDRLAASQHSPSTRSDNKNTRSPDILLASAIPACMAYALILPALLAAGHSTIRSLQYSSATLVEEGPFADYFAFGAITRIPGVNAPDAAARRAAAGAELSRLLSEGKGIGRYDSASAEYVVNADGIALLQQVPDVAMFGIVSATIFDFTMPLGSKVVPSHSVWLTPGMLQLEGRLGADVDLVMVPTVYWGETLSWKLLGEEALNVMGTEFRLCRRSQFWQLYARRTLPDSLCIIVDE